jgi:hypothetical protein
MGLQVYWIALSERKQECLNETSAFARLPATWTVQRFKESMTRSSLRDDTQQNIILRRVQGVGAL